MEDDRKNQNLRWKRESQLLVRKQRTASAALMATIVTLSATVLRASAPTLIVTKNKNCSRDFRPRIGLREEGKKREERRMWNGWYVNQRDFFL